MSHYNCIKEKVRFLRFLRPKKTGVRLSITNDESTSTRNRRFMNNAHFGEIFKSLGMARVCGYLP